MRNLFDIVEEVKDGGRPDYEELRYSLLVYVFMFNMEHRQLREELSKEKESPKFIKEMRIKNSFDMFKTALNKSPKEYLGWDKDPENPEYQSFRKLGNKLLEKIAGVNKNENT